MPRRRPSDVLLLLLALASVAAVLLSVVVLRQLVAGDGLPVLPVGAVPAAAASGG